MFALIEKNLIIVILSFSILALFVPELFLWVKTWTPLLLALIMFCIGSSLRTEDFKNTWNKKWAIIFTALLKYILMPVIAFIYGKLFRLSLNDLIGLIIIGSAPGGTAVNVYSYLSRSNVAINIVLTFVTTLIAPIAMPVIIYIFLHKHVNIPFLAMMRSIIFVVSIPLLAGIILKKYIQKTRLLIDTFPSLSIISIALILGCIVALNQKNLLMFPVMTILAVLCVNVSGYLVGYAQSKIFWREKADKRAIALEYGTQDGGLAVILTINFFGAAAALAGALYSVSQTIFGSLLIKLWKPVNRYNKSHILSQEKKS